MRIPRAIDTLNSVVQDATKKSEPDVAALFLHLYSGGAMGTVTIYPNDDIARTQEKLKSLLDDIRKSSDTMYVITYDRISDSIREHRIYDSTLLAMIDKLHAIEIHQAVRIGVKENAFKVISDLVEEKWISICRRRFRMKRQKVYNFLKDLKVVFKKHKGYFDFDDNQANPENTRVLIGTEELGTMDYKTIIGGQGIVDANSIQHHLDNLGRQK